MAIKEIVVRDEDGSETVFTQVVAPVAEPAPEATPETPAPDVEPA